MSAAANEREIRAALDQLCKPEYYADGGATNAVSLLRAALETGKREETKHYVQSPCGHGPLVDMVPYDGESSFPHVEAYRKSVGYRRWGITTVVLRRDTSAALGEPMKPRSCCSFQEGEFETEDEARKACEHEKRHSEKQLNEALAILEGAARATWTTARVYLSDLMQLREKLAAVREVCSAALCFEQGTKIWLVDEEEDACFCEAHLVGKKILTYDDREIVFESWAQLNEVAKHG